MKYIDNGSYFTVVVSRQEVEHFAAHWPCSDLPSRSISFQFDRSNGDLVEITPDSHTFDGPALLALSEDAQAFGNKQAKQMEVL